MTTTSRQSQFDHVYKYRDEIGVVIFEVVQFKNPKGFRQRKPGQKQPCSIDGVRIVRYYLPSLLADDADQHVWIAEGEKDVDRLGAMGRQATRNPMGAGKWRHDYSQSLKDRHSIITNVQREAPSKPPSAATYSAVFPKFASLPGTADLERARTWNRYIASLKMKGSHA